MSSLAEPLRDLAPLFDAAKAKDEFEFACSLLRIRGIEDAHWDPLQETQRLTNQMLALFNAPIIGDLRLRLLLFLYCHLTEADAIKGIVANMLKVTMGERYSMVPFASLPSVPGSLPQGHPLNRQAEQLVALALAASFPAIAEVYKLLFVRPVRNAFFHSDYILSPETFNIREGEGLCRDNLISNVVPLEWLGPRLELGINFALAVFSLHEQHIRSYRENKIVPGRFAADESWIEIELTADPARGLYGFRTPPKSAQ